MKKSKFLIPITGIAFIGAIAPVITMTACNNNKTGDITVDQKTIKSGDSYTTYKFKLPTVPADKKVKVGIVNKSTESIDKIYFNPRIVTSVNGWEESAEFEVDNNGNVEIPVSYMVAPTATTASTFGLTFTYDNDTITKTVNGLEFDYTVDYDVDLKDGNYDPETQSKVTPATADHWVDPKLTVAEIYMNDILEQPIRFQSDARYSTSKNIKAAIDNGDIKGLSSFKAYFNNVYADDYGLNVQMNYEVKSGSEGEFIFTQLQTTGNHRRFTFKNFDLSCNFMTANGYKFAWDGTDPKHFNLRDEHGQYDLVGRMKGTFTGKVERLNTTTGEYETVFSEKTVNYDGLIQWSDTNEETWKENEVAFMFAFGLIHLTYDFDWATETPSLKILSNYAKNA